MNFWLLWGSTTYATTENIRLSIQDEKAMKVSLISREISALSRITPTGKHILDILLVFFDNNDLNFLAAFLRRSARRCAFLRPVFLPGLFFFTVRNKHLSPKCIRLLKSECLVGNVWYLFMSLIMLDSSRQAKKQMDKRLRVI